MHIKILRHLAESGMPTWMSSSDGGRNWTEEQEFEDQIDPRKSSGTNLTQEQKLKDDIAYFAILQHIYALVI